MVDTEWYVERERPKDVLEVDQEKAAAAGVSPAMVAAVVRMAGGGETAGLLHDEQAREDVPIVVRLPRDVRTDIDAVRAIRLGGAGRGRRTDARGADGRAVQHLPQEPAAGDLRDGRRGRRDREPGLRDPRDEQGARDSVKLPEGYAFELFNTRQPDDSARYAMKWDGEWHITYEVFRDLGIAFAAVLLLIYILVVGWFQSFLTPITIMTVIPFSLVGILPAHAALGAFFTATSMIGFIAGAGIVVRNSIILVDFIELRLREGVPLAQAVVDAGAVRFRPMALTAAAVIVGSAVILFDPIFQGLAISLMAGEVASLLLSPLTVPVLYYLMNARARRRAATLAAAAPVVGRRHGRVNHVDVSARLASSSRSISARRPGGRSPWPPPWPRSVGAGLQLLHAEALEVPAYFTHDQMKALEREQARRPRAGPTTSWATSPAGTEPPRSRPPSWRACRLPRSWRPPPTPTWS